MNKWNELIQLVEPAGLPNKIFMMKERRKMGFYEQDLGQTFMFMSDLKSSSQGST